MSDELLMKLIAGGLIVFMAIRWLRVPLTRYFNNISIDQQPIKGILPFLAKNNEIRNRVFVTLAVLVAIRICNFIPLPGINLEAIKQFYSVLNHAPGMAAVIPNINGMGYIFSILGLGMTSFLSACIIIQILFAIISPLRKRFFTGEKARLIIVKSSYGLCIILALIQSYFMSTWLDTPSKFGPMTLATIHGLAFKIITMATLTGGVILLLFFAKLIDKYGIGNGIAIIMVTNIAESMIKGLVQLHLYNKAYFDSSKIIFLIAASAFLFCCAFFAANSKRKVLLMNETTKKEIEIPFRFCLAASVPVAFAQSIYLFPATMVGFVDNVWLRNFAITFIHNTWLGTFFNVLFIFIFTYLYVLLIVSPKNLDRLFKKFNYSLKLINAKGVEQYLKRDLLALSIIIAVMIVIFSEVPGIFIVAFKIPHTAIKIVNGLNILILLGVFFDIVKQLEFFYEKNKSSNKNLKIAYIAFDEIEAKIKQEYLKSKGFDALVEPLRFSWGMPIKTAVDEYRIYVPVDKIEEVRKLIG